MVSISRMEQAETTTPVSGFGPHVEELQEFFRSRGVRFGSAVDLPPFVERLQSDASFGDETASMVRTVIYRERDGLSRLELMELLATAVGGSEVDNAAAPEIREAVGKLMAFVESVFRTRRNPGGPVAESRSKPAIEETATAVGDAAAPHPMKDLFYRAQVVASGGVAETLAEEREEQSAAPTESVPKEDHFDQGEHWHIPLENFAPTEPERGSRVWLWIAGFCALLLAFSAGLFVHQKMLMPLRNPNQPYEAPPAEPAETTAPTTATVAPPRPRSSGTAVDADWHARASGKTSTASTVGSAGAGVKSSGQPDLRLRPVSRGTIGASPALMASYLIYAPPPGYPALAKITHIQGKVMVEAVVGKSGEVIEARAISGHRLLRGAAVREVYGRRYRPYVLDDRPRDVATIVAVDFRLK